MKFFSMSICNTDCVFYTIPPFLCLVHTTFICAPALCRSLTSVVLLFVTLTPNFPFQREVQYTNLHRPSGLSANQETLAQDVDGSETGRCRVLDACQCHLDLS